MPHLGWWVKQVTPVPGQPNLRETDLATEINGISIQDMPEQEQIRRSKNSNPSESDGMLVARTG